MRSEPRPTSITINLPSLSDEAAVEIQSFLYEVLELFATQYGHQVQRFYDDHSYDNLVHPDPHQSTEEPPF